MNLQENIRRILREVRVPKSERVELYKDDNIIVVVPLTHRALQKYAHQCQWCINDDLGEWEYFHKGKHAIIIQRKPKKPKIGIKYPIPSEIFTIEHYTNIVSIYHILGHKFSSNEERDDYMDEVTSNIDNFATNIVYYSPSDSLYDQEDNYLPDYGYSISDIPNVTPEVIQIMDDYLQENEEMSIQENIKRILREELNESLFFRRRINMDSLNKRAFQNLNDATDTFLKRYNQGQKFNFSQFKSVVIDYLMDSYHNELSNGGSKDFPYDEVYEFLSEYYHDKIKDRYELMFGGNINESIRRIIREERKDILKSKLLSIIKNEGTEFAAELIGGMDNLFRTLDIKTPKEFLDLFKGLNVIKNGESIDDDTYYKSDNGNVQLVATLKTDYIKLYVSSIILEGLKHFYDKESDIIKTIKQWVKDEYNLNEYIHKVLYFLPSGDLIDFD